MDNETNLLKSILYDSTLININIFVSCILAKMRPNGKAGMDSGLDFGLDSGLIFIDL